MGGLDGWRRLVAAASVAVYGWWATSLRPFSASALVAVLSAGAAAIAVGARRGRAHRLFRPPLTRGTAAWAGLLLALGGWELSAYLRHPRAANPTISALANTALDSHGARALAFVVWVAGAARLARR